MALVIYPLTAPPTTPEGVTHGAPVACGASSAEMRVLFSSLPATGHLNSLLPLAEAVADAGHEVAICATPAFADDIAKAGFEHLPGGAESVTEFFRDAPPRSDPDRWRWAHRVAFATRAVDAMLPDLERHADRWRPSIIVRETAEFAGCLVAERMGLPHASLATGSWSGRDRMRHVVTEELDGWRAKLGLAPDPSAQMVFRYLSLGLTPPHWDDDDHPPTAHFVRYRHPRARQEPRPAWLDASRDRPLVLASLGTVHHAEAGIFEAIIEAVAEEPIEVVVAIGRDQDPARFGVLPANVRLEPFVPQLAVLEEAAAFITHGGFNSAKEALSMGIPLLVIPIGGDQPYTAERVEALGLGRRAGPHERTADIIRARLRDVLQDPTYRTAARAFAADMAALPGLDHAVRLLERLARDREPIVR
jgi:UDP:flavonoid glycosyltransferase YjiC (YdhE family)